MIVLTLTDCPPALRGDLTKWLQEISIGVYIGQVSARVRDEIWKRVQESAKSGRATMVFSANNEQRMDFRVHNTGWKPIDFDGLKLMMRPGPAAINELNNFKKGFSNAAKMHKSRLMSGRKRSVKPLLERFAVVDVETTGLSPVDHEIIEICAIIVINWEIESEFHAFVKTSSSIPESIKALTGLSDDIVRREGRELTDVIRDFLEFVSDLPVVSHNSDFDYSFLRSACKRCGLPLFSNRCVDTLVLARRLVDNVKNYKLETLINHFGIKASGVHRSSNDCLSTKQLYEKLIELQNSE